MAIESLQGVVHQNLLHSSLRFLRNFDSAGGDLGPGLARCGHQLLAFEAQSRGPRRRRTDDDQLAAIANIRGYDAAGQISGQGAGQLAGELAHLLCAPDDIAKTPVFTGVEQFLQAFRVHKSVTQLALSAPIR